ncbi:hypothetical protein NWE48_23605 [Escherichia coli]|nr:hypothetical protein [Escherichia coli]
MTDAFGNTLGRQTVSVLADNAATVAPTVTTQPDGLVEISVAVRPPEPIQSLPGIKQQQP